MCRNCDSQPPIAKGRCEPCYRYHRKHGRERPERFWESTYRRRYKAFNEHQFQSRVSNWIQLNP